MSNYSEEQTNMLVGAYLDQPTRETVEKLAEQLGRSVKSIIGKLSREGVYRREVYVSKTGESPITKVEIVNNIAENLGVESRSLAGLEKSPKAALRNLEKAVAGLQQLQQGHQVQQLGGEIQSMDGWDLENDPEYAGEVLKITLNGQVHDIKVPKWTMTEDPYGDGIVSIDWNIDDPKDPHLTYVTSRGGPDPQWDIKWDPEYEPNVQYVKEDGTSLTQEEKDTLTAIKEKLKYD